jgi:hypothetical protein
MGQPMLGSLATTLPVLLLSVRSRRPPAQGMQQATMNHDNERRAVTESDAATIRILSWATRLAVAALRVRSDDI